jgi:division protein CdvB (Snf7/Vps24/ESCRT-III family)
MDGNEEVITVLKEIRDEARQTNVRLDQVNARLDSMDGRLESIDGRLDFMDRRMSKGFERLSRQFGEVEAQLVPQMASATGAMREVRDLLEMKLDDHAMVIDHEHRIKALERRDTPQP